MEVNHVHRKCFSMKMRPCFAILFEFIIMCECIFAKEYKFKLEKCNNITNESNIMSREEFIMYEEMEDINGIYNTNSYSDNAFIIVYQRSKLAYLEYKPWRVRWIFDTKIQSESFQITTNAEFDHYLNAHRIRIEGINLFYFSDYYVFSIDVVLGQLQTCFTLKNNHNQQVLSGIYMASFDKRTVIYYTLDNSLLCKYFPNEKNTTECFKVSHPSQLSILHPNFEDYKDKIMYINGDMFGYLNLDANTQKRYAINTELNLKIMSTDLTNHDSNILGLAIYADYSFKIVNFTLNGEKIADFWMRYAMLEANEDSFSFKLKIIDCCPDNIALISRTHFLIYRSNDRKFENIKLKSPNSMLYLNSEFMFAFRSGTKINDNNVLRVYKGEYIFSLLPPTCSSFESDRVEDIMVSEINNPPEPLKSNLLDHTKIEIDHIKLGSPISTNITFKAETAICENTFGLHNTADIIFKTKKQTFEYDLRELVCIMNSSIKEINISAFNCIDDGTVEWISIESEILSIK